MQHVYIILLNSITAITEQKSERSINNLQQIYIQCNVHSDDIFQFVLPFYFRLSFLYFLNCNVIFSPQYQLLSTPCCHVSFVKLKFAVLNNNIYNKDNLK